MNECVTNLKETELKHNLNLILSKYSENNKLSERKIEKFKLINEPNNKENQFTKYDLKNSNLKLYYPLQTLDQIKYDLNNSNYLTNQSISYLERTPNSEISVLNYITKNITEKNVVIVPSNKHIDNNINLMTYNDELIEYLKSLRTYLPFLKKRGLSIKYLQNNSYFFSKNNNNYNIINNQINITTIKNINKLLKYFFKSLSCIISKPVFYISGDKVIIELFYYLNIPKSKIFKLFSLFFNSRIQNLFKFYKKKSKFKSKLYKKLSRKFNLQNKIFKYKLKKSIFKLKNKFRKYILTKKKNKLIETTEKGKIINNEISTGKFQLLQLFKYNLNKVYENKFIIICNVLSLLFKRPVELHLTRLHKPYNNSNILVNLLAMNLNNKRTNSRFLIKKIYNKKPIRKLNTSLLDHSYMKNNPKFIKNNKIVYSPISLSKLNYFDNLIPNLFISGLNIKIAGRLMREPIIPRLTTKNFEKGARATGKVNLLDTSSFTGKNKKGAFTIKIITGQNFYI